MKITDRNNVLAIIAALFVLFSAMLNPLVTVAVVIIALIALAIYKLSGRANPKG